MGKGGKRRQTGELVRFSPRQFSAAVALVVLITGGAYILGYHRGIRSTEVPAGSISEKTIVEDDQAVSNPGDPVKTDNVSSRTPTMTFYSQLAETRVGNPPTGAVTTGGSTQVGKGKVREQSARVPPRSVGADHLPKGRGVMIQVGSYRAYERAKKLLDGLMASGHGGTVTRADLGPRGTWYRVRLGPYAGTREAGDVLKVLESKMSIKGFIVR